MTNKNIITTVIITCLIGVVLVLTNFKDKLLEKAPQFYQVYLNGKIIGSVNDQDALFALIDDNQTSIKNKYKVDTVYPPTDLKVVKTSSFTNNSKDINSIYEEIEKNDNFTIKGYTINIKGENDSFTINVLDKEVFYNAAKRFANAFLDENEYENYINNTQETISNDIGRRIEKMYFKENISITENYISVNDKIYTDELELSQYLLFGDNPNTKLYTVKSGDKISSIALANKLNSEEFLIANPNFKTEESILQVGETVNVTLINPKLTFVYELDEISDEIVYYEKKTVRDKNKPTTYKEVTTPGHNGMNRVREKYSVTNGEREQGVDPIDIIVIREKQDQITTIGTRYDGPIGGGNPVVLDGDWSWPTNSGYVITSYYGYRWGRMHNGIDISGAGNFGSNIYAAADGVVIKAFNGCPSRGSGYGDPCGGELGNQIIIEHANGNYTTYAHLHQTIRVSVGQTVKKGQVIGYMGNSGSSTGTHLHYAISSGSVSGNYSNPLNLYR